MKLRNLKDNLVLKIKNLLLLNLIHCKNKAPSINKIDRAFLFGELCKTPYRQQFHQPLRHTKDTQSFLSCLTTGFYQNTLN